MTDGNTKIHTQAEKILKAYEEDYDGLTDKECIETGFSKPQCEVLVGALGNGLRGEITTEERARLELAGFAKEFIATIAGVDGKAALQRRTIYFASKVQSNISRLQDPDLSVRIRATWMLGKIADPAAVPALITALKEPNRSVRVNAAWALSQIVGHSGVSALITALKEPDRFVREDAAWALGNMMEESDDGRRALIPYLRDLDQMVAGKVDDCNVDCQNSAAVVLQKLEEQMR